MWRLIVCSVTNHPLNQWYILFDFLRRWATWETCGALSIHEFSLWWPTMTWETYHHNKKIFYHNNFILFESEFQCCVLNVWYSSLACWIYQWNVKIYLHCLLFPNTGIVQASGILPRRRIAPVYPTWPISWMLMTWRRKEISNHDIDLTILELSGFSTRAVNFNSSPRVPHLCLRELGQHWFDDLRVNINISTQCIKRYISCK